MVPSSSVLGKVRSNDVEELAFVRAILESSIRANKVRQLTCSLCFSELPKSGWQTGGLALEVPSYARVSDPFSSPFRPSLPFKPGDITLGTIFGVVLALSVASPLPPTPFANLYHLGSEEQR